MSDDNPVIPESQPEQPAQPVQPPAPATPPVTAPAPQPAPAPAVAPQVPAPAAAPAAPAAAPAGPAPELGADQLAAEKKAAIVDAKKQAIRAKGAKKRLILKLVGAFFFVMLLVFAVTFVMLGSNTGGGSNPLLQLFGLSEEQLYPFLINMVNILFGLANFIAFIFGGIGLAKVAMSKKDEKIKKKKGLITMSIGMGLFIVISIVWAGSYFYLQDLKAQYLRTTQGEVQYVLTDPVDTNNLSAPATIEFDATELPVDARKFTIISYAWDFGDESTATGSKVSHRYTAKGEEDGRYIVELTVAYRDKATSEEAEEIFTVDVVFANEKVNAAFSADPSTGSIPLVVQFDASESIDPDGEISEYEWDLDGDGKYDDGDEEQVEYTYDKFGTYTVKLRVTDNNGESDVEEMDIVVDEGQLPTAEIDVDLEDEGTAFANETYIFKANNASSPNGSVTKYEWDFGDGTTTTKNKTAQHEFVKAGTYTITLTLIDEDDEKGTVTMEVEVEDEASAPVPVIMTDQTWSTEAENEIRGEVPLTVKFTSDSTDPDDDIVNVEWDLDGDNTVDEASDSAEFTYQDAGTYKVTLYLEDAEGHTSETSINIVADAQGLNAQVTADTLNGEVPLTIRFDASGSSYPDGSIVNYFWDFGDGTTRYDKAQLNYTFTAVGTHEVILKAISADGTEATDTLFINVLPVSLAACFDSNVDSGKAPVVATFNPSCSTGTVANWRWDFGDGSVNYIRKPTHTFETPGTYTVTLTVEDTEGFSNTFSQPMSVYGDN